MTKRMQIISILVNYFLDTNTLKLTSAEIRVILANENLTVGDDYLSNILNSAAKNGIFHSVKVGEFMLGHKGDLYA